jgi:hypothetical protein
MNNVKGVAAHRVFQAAPELKVDLRSVHLWITGYHDRLIRDVESLYRVRGYIEQNPVRLGYPRQRYEWVMRIPFEATSKSTPSRPALQGGDG